MRSVANVVKLARSASMATWTLCRSRDWRSLISEMFEVAVFAWQREK
jgi:hypothetical protein